MGEHGKGTKPNLTIVGGQPRPDRVVPGSENTEIPIGFEMLLYRAAEEPEFREQLLSNRAEAIADSGVELRPSERNMLTAIPDRALERMIHRLEPERRPPRRLMGNVAAAVASLAAGTAALGGLNACGDDGGGGSGATATATPAGVGGAGVGPGGTGGTAGSTTTTTPTGVGGAGVGPGGTGGFAGGGGTAGGGGMAGGGGNAGGG